MAWLNAILPAISLFALITGLVAGIFIGPSIRKKTRSSWLKGAGILLFLTPFALMLWTSRMPSAGLPPPPSLAEEEAARARLPAVAPARKDTLLSTRPSAQEKPRAEFAPLKHKASTYPPRSPIITQSSANGIERKDAITRLVIPPLRVDARVYSVPYDGTTWEIENLDQDVAWLEPPAGVNLDNNTVLAGHITLDSAKNGPFRYLFLLAPGDRVRVYTEKYVYLYAVTDQQIVDATDASVITAAEQPQLTLVTRTDWDEQAHFYRRRRIVFARLIAVETRVRSGVD